MGGIVGIIPARFGSSRFPGKPLALIRGKSLIQRTYENSCRSELLDRVIVATDDQRIFDHVVDFGGEVVMTSSACATGTDRLAEAVERSEAAGRASVIVNIQGDWPCIEPQVIDAVASLIGSPDDAPMGSAVIRLRDSSALFNPSMVKCVVGNHGEALYFSRSPIPYPRDILPGQPLPPHRTYFGHLGIYSYRRDFLKVYAGLAPTPLQMVEDLEQLKALESGYRIKITEVESVGLSVDTPGDVGKVEQYLCSLNTSSSLAVSSPL